MWGHSIKFRFPSPSTILFYKRQCPEKTTYRNSLLKLAPTCGIVIQFSPLQSVQQHIAMRILPHEPLSRNCPDSKHRKRSMGDLRDVQDSVVILQRRKKPNVFMKVCTILQEECKVCKQSGARRR
jgi:hypothetical protein